MIEPAIPRNEAARLAALRALGLLDSAPEKAFDEIVELARMLLDVPTALVSLVDSDRQWFKAAAGIAACETSRSVSFCAHAIHQPDVFVVPDATLDPRFHDNPLVEGEPYIRFYAGFPLTLPNGARIGTLCVLSPVPREAFDEVGRAKMRLLGALTLDAIELRTARAELLRLQGRLDRNSVAWHSLDLPVAFAGADGNIEFCNAAFALLCGSGEPIGRALADALGLAPSDWAPDARTGRIESKRLTVHRVADGFAVVGDPGVR